MIRSFIAVDLPDEITEKLWKIAVLLDNPGINPVKRENMHITLKFLGNTDQTTLERIAERLKSKINLNPFFLEISGLGAFPGERNPRVVWAGTGDGAENMKQLASIVDNTAGKFGFRRERRPFVPHSTIARVKRTTGETRALIKDVIRKYSDANFGKFMVEAIKIKKSTLTREGPIYEDLHILRLEGADEP